MIRQEAFTRLGGVQMDPSPLKTPICSPGCPQIENNYDWPGAHGTASGPSWLSGQLVAFDPHLARRSFFVSVYSRLLTKEWKAIR